MCKLMKLFFCLALFMCQATSTEVIYSLSKENYARMPIKVHLDRFAFCLNEPDGVYCTAYADVVSDGPSELLDMMRGYSAFERAHFNYTRLRYGMCMTQTCREYYNGTSEPELQVALEACLNDTMSRRYGLKTRVTRIDCNFEDETKNNRYTVDWVDWAVSAFLLIIFALNVIGSAYDYMRDRTKPGNKVLLSFSWRRNWEQLMAPLSKDPRVAELQSINGVRFLTCMIIVLGHFAIASFLYLEDPRSIEKIYDQARYHAIINGNLVTQSFLLMSGFLLVYNTQISMERQPITWKKYITSIVLRYLRLSTTGLFVVMLTATWMRFGSHGPLWQGVAGVEVDDCRHHWIYNALLVQNYVDFSICGIQTWSSASDFHLHILGLTVILLAPSAARRRVLLAIIGAVGLLWPVYTVVTMDLEGILQGSPEHIRNNFIREATFHNVYKPSHSNIPVFIIGMTFGYIVYDLQTRKVTTQDHTKYRFVYWFLVPLLFSVLSLSGYYFYQEVRAPLLLRALYTPVVKPLFGLIVMLIILGAVLKVETLYRGILEWNGFVPLAKLSFNIYTLHISMIRYIGGSRSTLMHYSPMQTLVDFFGCWAPIMMMSFVLYMAVEAPSSKLAKMAFEGRPPPPQIVNGKKTK